MSSNVTRLVPAKNQTAEDLALALERVGASGDHQIATSTLGGPEGCGTTKDLVSLLGAVCHARCNLELALIRALEG